MPYIVKSSGVGPWAQGAIVEDKVLNAHPFAKKFIRNGSVVRVSAADAKAAQATNTGAQVADLDEQIAALQAQRAALLAGDTAPAAVTYELDPTDPPTTSEANATRAAGLEVLQPQPGTPVVGTVVPVEERAAAPADKKDKK